MSRHEVDNLLLHDVDRLITYMKLYRRSEDAPYIEYIVRSNSGYKVVYYADEKLI